MLKLLPPLPLPVRVAFFSQGHQLIDFCSNLLWALAAPMLIYCESSHRTMVRALLRLPPLRMMVDLSKFSFSFYVWQFPVLQLLQLQVVPPTMLKPPRPPGN